MRLEGKKIVMVGGAAEMARTANPMLLAEGAELFLIDYAREALALEMKALQEYTGQVHSCEADVRDLAQMQTAMFLANRKMGRIDAIVNIAGIIKHRPIDEMTAEEWQSVIDVNLTGCFNSCKAAVPYMKRQHYGRIINISSVGGRTGRPGVGVNYAASKAGIVGITMLLARELAEFGITVNAIAPGPLKGSMFYGMPQDVQDRLSAGIPVGDLGNMDQVGYAIIYLAGDEASYCTGEVLDINGGTLI